MKRRVVVTGLGAVTPIGNTVDEFWTGIRTGKTGIGPITRFDAEGYKAQLAAEVKDFNARERMDVKAARIVFAVCSGSCIRSKRRCSN